MEAERTFLTFIVIKLLFAIFYLLINTLLLHWVLHASILSEMLYSFQKDIVIGVKLPRPLPDIVIIPILALNTVFLTFSTRESSQLIAAFQVLVNNLHINAQILLIGKLVT